MPLTLSPLAQKTCKAREGNADALSDTQIQSLLSDISGWQRAGGEISKTYNFKNYYEAMAFVNMVAWLSHREDHHPDMEVGYNKVRVRYSTHSVGGLSENDFICAAKIESLLEI